MTGREKAQKRIYFLCQTHFYRRGYLGGKLEMLTAISDSMLETKGESSVASKISASVSASITGGYGSFSGMPF